MNNPKPALKNYDINRNSRRSVKDFSEGKRNEGRGGVFSK
jgi:hypothetical protein